MNNKLIGERVRYYRRKKGLTQQNLADKVGVTWEMISRYERGETTILGKLEELSSALEIAPAIFVSSGYESEGNSQLRNFLPFIISEDLVNKIKKISDLEKVLQNTYNFYTCPDWIMNRYPDSFAIDSSIIKSDTISTVEKGILYISQMHNVDNGALNSKIVMYLKDSKIMLSNYSKDMNKSDILGILIAQEERFV